jgi:hypothetical protein
MQLTIRLRGHHLLCLLGYRGMGYSEAFCKNMTSIYETLRLDPQTQVEIVAGPDDICEAYPDTETSHCEGMGVYGTDALVLQKLELNKGRQMSWSVIVNEIAVRLEPDDIARICTTCRWQPLGVCKEGVRLVNNGLELPPIPTDA